MTKFGDVITTIVFTSIFGWYSLQVLLFGGLTGDNPILYSLSSFAGIILIYILFQDKYYHKLKLFATLRLFAIFLQFPAIYFELKHEQDFRDALMFEKILMSVFNFTSFLLLLYLTVTILRILALRQELKTGDTWK